MTFGEKVIDFNTHLHFTGRLPAGIRMIRIDRKTGRRVFGAWPDGSYYSSVIWEAFKPESEPRRTIRRDEIAKRAAPAQRATTDSEFLQSQDGIY